MGEEQNEYLDFEYLRELSDNDEDFIRDLVATFITDIEKRIAQLQQAVEQNRSEERKSCAHTIRGAAQNVGALILVDDSNALENGQQCDEDRELCLKHASELQRKFVLTKKYIELYLAS